MKKKQNVQNQINKLKEEIESYVNEIENDENIKEKQDNVLEKLQDLYRNLVNSYKDIILRYNDLRCYGGIFEYSEYDYYKEKQLEYDEKYITTSEKLDGVNGIYFASYLRLNNQLYDLYRNKRNQVVHNYSSINFNLSVFEKDIKPNIYVKIIDNLDKAIKNIEMGLIKPDSVQDEDRFFKDSHEILGDLHIHKALLIKKFESGKIQNIVREAKIALENYNKSINYGKKLEEKGITYYSFKADVYMEIFNEFFYEDKLGNLEKISNLIEKRNHIEKKFNIWEKLTSKRFNTKPLRGMKDFFPKDLCETNWIRSSMEEVADLYCYEEFEGPLLEPIEIFAAKSSHELVFEQSFYVEKFQDKKIILRPELTPTLARMIAQKSQELKKPIRWFSIPTCFRWEQPQRGRLRSFKQVNFDMLGEKSLYAELEIFNIIVDILTGFGATEDQFQVYFNNRRFIDALCKHILLVPSDKMSILYKILDKSDKMDDTEFEKLVIDTFKNEFIVQGILKLKEAKNLKELLSNFKTIPQKFYESEGYKELTTLEKILKDNDLSQYCSFSSSIVRGLDYYTGTVFEVFDTGSENTRAIFGGGRYDDLLSLFSDEQLTGIGFGMGTLMLSLFLKTYNLIPPEVYEYDYRDTIYIASINNKVANYAIKLAQMIREEDLPCIVDYRFGGLKNQLAKAGNLGVLVTLIIGPKEMEQNKVSVKNMVTEAQKTINLDDLLEEIYEILDESEPNDEVDED